MTTARFQIVTVLLLALRAGYFIVDRYFFAHQREVEGYVLQHSDAKIGVIDSTGKVLAAPRFGSISAFKGGTAIASEWYSCCDVCRMSGRYNRMKIRKDGSVVEWFGPSHINNILYKEGEYPYSAIDTQAGCYITNANHERIAGPFTDCLAMSADLIIVRNQGALFLFIPGKIYKKLDQCIAAKTGISSSVIAVETKSGWGLINRKGEFVVTPHYGEDDIGIDGSVIDRPDLPIHVSKRVTKVHQSKKDSDSKGKGRVDIGGGLFAFKVSDCAEQKYGLVKSDGTIVKEPTFSEVTAIDPQANNPAYWPASISLDGEARWGWIDQSGNWVIQPQYASAGVFSEGLASFGDKPHASQSEP